MCPDYNKYASIYAVSPVRGPSDIIFIIITFI